ncbi:MAG: YabP/YqfC family sporulation protein [Lachnospiraceae bacterium]
MQNKKLAQMQAQMVETLELPKDIVYGAAILTVTGQSEILVENQKGILEYTTECIRLQVKDCQLKIEGRNLTIPYYTADEMRITGVISSIIFQS